MTKILIPVTLEDGKSCRSCPCKHYHLGGFYYCEHLGINLGDDVWASERPTRCIDELGGGE